jgi:hypothetical protein
MAHNDTEIGTLIKNGNMQEAATKLVEILATANGNTVHAAMAADVHHATLKRWITTLDVHYDVRGALEKIRLRAREPVKVVKAPAKGKSKRAGKRSKAA